MDFDLVQVDGTAWSGLFPQRDWLGVAQEVADLIDFTPEIELSSELPVKLRYLLAELGVTASDRAKDRCELFGALSTRTNKEIRSIFETYFTSDHRQCWFHLWAEPPDSLSSEPLMDVFETETLKVVRTAVPTRNGDRILVHYHYLAWDAENRISECEELVELVLHSKDILVDLARSVGWNATLREINTQHIGTSWLHLTRF